MASTHPLLQSNSIKDQLEKIDNVQDRQGFNRWKSSFLATYEQHLDPAHTQVAAASLKKFSKHHQTLINTVERLQKLIQNKDITTSKCSVKARQCLCEFKTSIAVVCANMVELVPATLTLEKRQGYSKFNLGAILVRDGFREYFRLTLCNDLLQSRCKAVLAQCTDPEHLAAIDLYRIRVESLCDILADLGK